MTDARALAGYNGMPIRAAVSDGVPVGKKLQTGIEVKKSVGLAVHPNNSQRRGAARQAEVKFSQDGLRRARSQGNIQITFFTLRRGRSRPGKLTARLLGRCLTSGVVPATVGSMNYKDVLTKKLVSAHIGHDITVTADITVRCSTCSEDIWRHADALARRAENQRLAFIKMKAEDPERYRKINRTKSAKHRARVKKDPVKYAAYLENAKKYNAKSRARAGADSK